MRAQCVEEFLEVGNSPAPACVALHRGIGRRVVQPELVLDVDDQRVDLRSIGDVYQLMDPLGALCSEAVHIEAAHDLRVGQQCRRSGSNRWSRKRCRSLCERGRRREY